MELGQIKANVVALQYETITDLDLDLHVLNVLFYCLLLVDSLFLDE